jgi:1-acyl-sn-glycerol-3-phosphate acyltransferase
MKGESMSVNTNDLHVSQNDVKFIDIEKVIAGKSQRLARILPRFILRYLRRILHEDSLNRFLNEHKDVYGLKFTDAILAHFGVSLMVYGLSNLKTNERVIIAANHPLGGLDGVTIMNVAGRVWPDIIFPVNDLLLHLPNLRDYFIPVNKHGGNPKEAVRMFDEMMASDKTILYFPAGLVSRKKKGKIADLEWKKTFVSKAKKHSRKIIPVYIEGKNSKFFYNLANLRKFLKIKTNIEMLYLVDEMYKQYDQDIKVFIGSAVSFDDLPQGMNDEQIAGYIKNLAYDLPTSPLFSPEEVLRLEFKNNESQPCSQS